MGDEMDECACFWSHEFAMRRLLALLRQSQTHCTDTECFDQLTMPGMQNQSSDSGGDFMFMSMLLICAVILYLFRPNRRSIQNDNDKVSRPPTDQNGPDGTPPAIH